MTTRKKILIAFAVLLLLAALLLMLLGGRGEGDIVNERLAEDYAGSGGGALNVARANLNVSTGEQPAPEPETPPAPPDYRASVKRLAAAFAERFGSFSNVGNFENVLDLKALMTDSMADWADGYVADQRANQGDTTIYFSITTKAIRVELTGYEEAEGTAAATVLTQRTQESGDTPGATTYYQDMEVKMVKDGDTWKVDFAKWGERRTDLGS